MSYPKTKTFAINCSTSRFDLVTMEFDPQKIVMKGKKLFTPMEREEIVKVKHFYLPRPGGIQGNMETYNLLSSYLNYNLDSRYFTAEILTWLESISAA